jgi:acetyltransferase-like isoleucine patch superfamily enzyme
LILGALKRYIKDRLNRPRGIVLGENSIIMLPRWLHHRERIRIGARTTIGRFAVLNPLPSRDGIAYDGRIHIGDDVYIGGYCQIHAMAPLEIGDGAVLSEHVYISDTSHGLNPLHGPIMTQPLESKGPVRIGKSVFVGFGAAVLPGVTLGDHCVVGTRAVVTRSFPPYSMVAGSPARRIKVFDLETREWVPAPDA